MRNLMLCALLCIAFAGAARANPLIAERITDAQSLLPYCSWLMDDRGALGIGDVSTGRLPGAFVAFSRPPLKAIGPVWIRMTLFKTATPAGGSIGLGGSSRLVVNLGPIQNGQNEIYYSEAPGPIGASGIWHSEKIWPYEGIRLPEPGLTPINIFIRLEEAPGPWFAPTVQAEHTAHPAVLPSELLLPGLLIAAAIACLLRAMAGRAQWALWSALFLATGVYQAVMPIPSAGRHFVFADLPALLAPGLAIMLLPHVGRRMFSADPQSKWRNRLLYFCSLLGAGAALAPLLPDFGWLVRIFPLAPLLLLPLLPVCLDTLAAKKPGSLAFFGATVMPLLGAGCSLYALLATNINPLASALTAQGGLWGMAVGGLGLALSRMPVNESSNNPVEQDSEEPVDLALSGPIWGDRATTGVFEPDRAQNLDTQDRYTDLQPLPMTPAANDSYWLQAEAGNDVPGEENGAFGTDNSDEISSDPTFQFSDAESVSLTPDVDDAPDLENDAFLETEPDAIADNLTQPYDDAPQITEATPESDFSDALPDSGAIPEEPAQEAPDAKPEVAPPFAPPQTPATLADPGPLPAPLAENSDSALPNISDEVISLIDDDFSDYAPAATDGLGYGAARHITLVPGGGYLFNLHAMVREVHDMIAPVAKSRGLIFSWFIAPYLPVLLEGDAPRLRGALSLLLQSAVQASHEGAVQLVVRRKPKSDRPEDLLFTISDNGSAQRTDAGFFHAWELAAKSGGSFNVDYSQTGGTRISFSVRFVLPSEKTAREHLALAPVNDSLEYAPGDDLTQITAFDLPVAKESFGYDAAAPSGSLPGSANGVTPVTAEPTFDRDGPVHSFARVNLAVREDYFAQMSLQESHRLSAPLSDQIDEHHQDLLAEHGDALLDQSAQRPGSLSGLRIVAAEMTSGKRKLLTNYLHSTPYTLVYAESNAELLKLAANDVPTLYLFDGDMPEADIVTVTAALRNMKQSTAYPRPLLVLAGHDHQAERLRQAGIDHTLTKPFGPGELRAAVARAILDLGLDQKSAGATDALPTPDRTDHGEYQASQDLKDTPPAIGAEADEPEERPTAKSAPGKIVLRSRSETTSTPNAKDNDPLERAMRTALQQNNTPPRVVDLPPRHGISSLRITTSKSVRKVNAKPAQKIAPQLTAPSNLGQPAQDAPDTAALADHDRTGGSLLDFALPENHTPDPKDPELKTIAPAPVFAFDDPAAFAQTPEPTVEETTVPIADFTPTAEAPAGTATAAFEPELAIAENAPDPGIGQRFPLPGIDDEYLDASVIPLAPGIIHALGDILEEAAEAKAKGSTMLLQDATGRLAARAEHFGLHKLGKIARCVERAAEADDMEASATLFDDLEPVTRRYMTAIHQCFQNFMNLER